MGRLLTRGGNNYYEGISANSFSFSNALSHPTFIFFVLFTDAAVVRDRVNKLVPSTSSIKRRANVSGL